MKLKMVFEYWPVEYASDALDVLIEKEKKISKFLYQSPQLLSRPLLVKWILHLCEQFKLGNSTVHLAIYILDRFMDGHSILQEKLNLTVLTCLQLAAKFEERDVCVPKISELSVLADNQYQRMDFIQFESFILKYLDWSLSLPTAIKFVEYYSLVAVSQSEWNVQMSPSYEKFWNEVQQGIKYYLDLSLEDAKMLRFKPSQVACSCIILARRQVGVKPLWSPRLVQITRYKFIEISPCAHTLLRFSMSSVNRKRKATTSPDQGYVSQDYSGTSPPLKKASLAKKNS